MKKWFLVGLILAGCGDAFEPSLFTALELPDARATDAAPDVLELDAAPDVVELDTAPDVLELDAAPDVVELDAAPDAVEDAAPDAALLCPSSECTAWCASLGSVDVCRAGLCSCV